MIKKFFNIPENFYTKENRYLIIATLGGIGYAKKAPGTVASFVTLLFYLPLFWLSHSILIVLTTLFIIVGIFVCDKIFSNSNEDPSYIVIDEVVGQSIALLLVGESVILAILAFIIFRLLDIYKPWIIKTAETSFKGSIAIMMDDIIAGFCTLIIVTIISIFIR